MVDVNDFIEQVIDGSSLGDVLGMIASICSDKAQHVESNWGDGQLADTWSAAAFRIKTLAEECEL